MWTSFFFSTFSSVLSLEFKSQSDADACVLGSQSLSIDGHHVTVGKALTRMKEFRKWSEEEDKEKGIGNEAVIQKKNEMIRRHHYKKKWYKNALET